MIKEIVQFTDTLDEGFKSLGTKVREGLHILIKVVEESENIFLDVDNVQYERYTKKLPETDFLQKCKFLSVNAWCIDTNKCFDLPTKAIHSCSPFCVAFKREHLEGGVKYEANQQKNKKQIDERFGDYFTKALDLLPDQQEREKYKVFKAFFSQGKYKTALETIAHTFATKVDHLDLQLQDVVEQLEQANNKDEKELYKQQKASLELQKEHFKPLEDSDYIIFYLDEPLKKYKAAHQVYLSDKLFNTSDYNTSSDEQGDIYGTNNFLNGYNQKMPFLMHKTATFDINGRISDKEAKALYEFQQVLGRKTLPNPLPLFIYKEELQASIISLYKENELKLSYKEIIEKLWERHDKDFENYYLLFYTNTKDGLVFKDFDFVTKFEYELRDKEGRKWLVEDLFDIKYQVELSNIFIFQSQILQIIFNNNLVVKAKGDKWVYKYFDDIEEKYCKSAKNYLNVMRYRQACYDFIYKSKRQAISQHMFHEMMKTSILEDIRLDKVENNQHSELGNIRRKLNIWFSLYEKFNNNTHTINTMASNLKKYRQFVEELTEDKADLETASIEQFAFTAGQVIYYILQKSKSADTSYQSLEPYLQQVRCEELKKAISRDFARYKHENYSAKFEKAAAFVLTYETTTNLKKVLPELLAGIFSKNYLFSDKSDKKTETETESNK
ncbi:MAG: hypothetical protein ACFB0B_01775 [Thermonemataceae bacterium]